MPFLLLRMIERAGISELAFAIPQHILARLCLIVGVDSTKSHLAESVWKRVIWLTQLLMTMGELAELLQAAVSRFHVVLAQLGLILLLEGIELPLVTV